MTLAIIDGDVLLYMSIWNTESKKESQEKFDELFNNTMESVFATDYVMAFGGPNNFRVDLYPEYKANRSKSKSTRPDWFLDLKSDIVENYEGASLSDNCEADDMVRIWALEADAANADRVVISVDKDLDCIAGFHYNPRKQLLYDVNPEVANKFYWQQILMGDSVDNIPGIPGIGPKKAEKILEGVTCYEEAVCQAYDNHYGEEGYSYLLLNARLIHIWRKVNDHFKLSKERYDNAIKVGNRTLELPA
jgi:5'-3' exonuclease